MDSQSLDSFEEKFLQNRIYFCLDEAQCELTGDQGNSTKLTSIDSILALLHQNQDQTNMFSSTYPYQDLADRFSFLEPNRDPLDRLPFIAAGTSLQLESFKLVIEKNLNRSRNETIAMLLNYSPHAQIRQPGYKAKVFGNFEVVALDEDFVQISGSHVDRPIRKMR